MKWMSRGELSLVWGVSLALLGGIIMVLSTFFVPELSDAAAERLVSQFALISLMVVTIASWISWFASLVRLSRQWWGTVIALSIFLLSEVFLYFLGDQRPHLFLGWLIQLAYLLFFLPWSERYNMYGDGASLGMKRYFWACLPAVILLISLL